MTSDERIEIAERLRGANGIFAFVSALDIDLDSDWCWTDVSKHVADLIDPTCEREDEDTDEDSQYRGTSLCSECGELLISQFRYCPHCGARVTSGDEG